MELQYSDRKNGSLILFQNMSENGRTRTADILRHTDLRTVHLRFTALPSQLLDSFHDLVHTRRADWVAPSF